LRVKYYFNAAFCTTGLIVGQVTRSTDFSDAGALHFANQVV
jgi:hypothetical protein